jgi:hypothetical protein
MGFQNASLVRPGPITALAVLYGAGAVVSLLAGVAGSYSAPEYRLGEMMLPPLIARLFLLFFGAGLAFVSWGFYGLRSAAWFLFVYSICIALAVELVWVGLGGPRYLVGVAVDVALLTYVYRQRSYFIH